MKYSDQLEVELQELRFKEREMQTTVESSIRMYHHSL